MKAPAYIQQHSNFNADDYAYLVAKGWTNKQIAQRWTEEAAQGNGACQWATTWSKHKLAAVTAR